jgi:cold shock CspA family protein
VPTGTVKFVKPDKGYGFIKTANGDLFFHAKQTLSDLFTELKSGDPVQFEIEPPKENSKGPRAINVQRA